MRLCRNKGQKPLKESEGAMIVDLEDKNMPPCLIIRKDGGTLYATRDITAALYRKKTYNFDKCIYLTALDQNLHFAQWFEVIHKMGYDWYKDLIHVPFGLVSLDSGKLSTRHGHVVLMEDLLNQACAETKRIIEEKNPNLENKEEIAKQVGIGAVIFNDLYNTRIKDVVFSWERMLNFDGETGPYVQYTHARACSILKRAGEPVSVISILRHFLTRHLWMSASCWRHSLIKLRMRRQSWSPLLSPDIWLRLHRRSINFTTITRFSAVNLK